VGGFDPVLFGEDTVAVSKLLRCGHQIAYVAEAIVKHSHRYTLKHEFKRHFDIGLSRKSYGKLLQGAGKDTSRGATYAKELLRKTFQEKPHLLPYACLQTAIKLIGYKIGQYSLNAPHWLKKKLSSQDFYWENLRL
jgi:rhamnosyltransferase